MQREREAADAEPPIHHTCDSEELSARQQVAHQVDQLRRQHARTKFPQEAATALAARLAAAESDAAAFDPSAAREADAVLAVIQQLQESREFNRSRFVAHFLVVVGARPTLRAMWRLHTAQVVHVEQFLEAASDASLDAIVQGVGSLANDELRAGRDGAQESTTSILPNLTIDCRRPRRCDDLAWAVPRTAGDCAHTDVFRCWLCCQWEGTRCRLQTSGRADKRGHSVLCAVRCKRADTVKAASCSGQPCLRAHGWLSPGPAAASRTISALFDSPASSSDWGWQFSVSVVSSMCPDRCCPCCRGRRYKSCDVVKAIAE